jgi:hypothetical protein
VVLALLTGVLLFLFGGVTDRLIPLYAVGAFLAFTLSQAGMVRHWWKVRCGSWARFAFINGLGAFVTGITVVVVLVAKFAEGAWLTLLFIPLTLVLFQRVRGHYHSVAIATRSTLPVQPPLHETPPLVVIPIDRWSAIAKQGLEFALRLSPEVTAVHVEPGEHATLLEEDWQRYVVEPYRGAGMKPPELAMLPSPYRFVVIPIVEYVLKVAEAHPDRKIAVVIPEFVEDRWYEYFLHNQRARLLQWVLMAKGNRRIYTVSSPYYLSEKERMAAAGES